MPGIHEAILNVGSLLSSLAYHCSVSFPYTHLSQLNTYHLARSMPSLFSRSSPSKPATPAAPTLDYRLGLQYFKDAIPYEKVAHLSLVRGTVVYSPHPDSSTYIYIHEALCHVGPNYHPLKSEAPHLWRLLWQGQLLPISTLSQPHELPYEIWMMLQLRKEREVITPATACPNQSKSTIHNHAEVKPGKYLHRYQTDTLFKDCDLVYRVAPFCNEVRFYKCIQGFRSFVDPYEDEKSSLRAWRRLEYRSLELPA